MEMAGRSGLAAVVLLLAITHAAAGEEGLCPITRKKRGVRPFRGP